MENEMKYKISKDIDIEIPKEMKSMSFQSFFTFLRKTLQIKYTRRIHIDSILKKCKGKFYKAINDCLRKCLKINIKKLPQVYITNISIDYNKCFFDFTVNDLYTYFNLMPYPMETILQREYCVKGKEDFFKYIFLSKINNLYLVFIESHRYKKEIELMKKQKGIKLAFLHQFVAENFINYYYYSKPHIKKTKIVDINKKNNNDKNNNNAIINNNSNNYSINNINNNAVNNIFNISQFYKNIEKEKINSKINYEKNIKESKESKKYFFQIEKTV